MSAQAYYQSNNGPQEGEYGNNNLSPSSGYDYNQSQQRQYAQQAQQGYPQQAQQQYQPPQQPPQAYGQYNNTNYPVNQHPNAGGPNAYAMKPTAPYAPQQDAEGQYGAGSGAGGYNDNAPFSQATEKTGERMNPKPRFNDIIPLVLFLATFIGFVVLSVFALKDFAGVNGLGGGFGRGAGGSGVTLNL
jgi:hypothetical protein